MRATSRVQVMCLLFAVLGVLYAQSLPVSSPRRGERRRFTSPNGGYGGSSEIHRRSRSVRSVSLPVGPHDPHHFRVQSVCQWEHVENVDINRRPAILIEAKCAKSRSGHRFSCENIKYNMTVKRMTALGKFEDDSVTLSVGCATIGPEVLDRETVKRTS